MIIPSRLLRLVTFRRLYNLNSMSSLRVLQDTHAQHETQRVTLKQRLMCNELAQLDACLNKAKMLSKTIKAMHSSFRHQSKQNHSMGHIATGRMLRPTAKLLQEMHDLLNATNLTYRNASTSQTSDKKAHQGFFMHTLRTYEGRIGELNKKIKIIENSIQSHTFSNQDSEFQQEFDEGLTSYTYLEQYLRVQAQKQLTFRACVESAIGSATSINSQNQSKQDGKKMHSKKVASSILLKEKMVNERLKKKIYQLRRQQAAEKNSFQRLTKANKDINSRIASLHLQANIKSNSNFFLEADHYARHWKTMKEALDTRLSQFSVCSSRLHLSKSQSCAVMETAKDLQQGDSSMLFGNSVSIDNEESLLDNLEYFISEEFIKDLADHQID